MNCKKLKTVNKIFPFAFSALFASSMVPFIFLLYLSLSPSFFARGGVGNIPYIWTLCVCPSIIVLDATCLAEDMRYVLDTYTNSEGVRMNFFFLGICGLFLPSIFLMVLYC